MGNYKSIYNRNIDEKNELRKEEELCQLIERTDSYIEKEMLIKQLAELRFQNRIKNYNQSYDGEFNIFINKYINIYKLETIPV
jgi:hypothetical protein